MMKRVMFMTVGAGRCVVDSVKFAIQHYNPDQLVLLSTSEVHRTNLEGLLALLGVSKDAFESDGELRGTVDEGLLSGLEYVFPRDEALEQINDAEALHLVYRRIIRRVLRRERSEGAVASNAVADMTRGTKAMSAALFGAAYSLGVGTINFVTGRRDEDGLVISGTERCHATQGRRLRAFEKLEDAVDLFNRGEFVEAGRTIDELEDVPDIHLPADGEGRTLLRTAAAAFAAWDRFRFQEALDHFQRLGDADHVDPAVVGTHLMNKDDRQAVQRHLARSHNEEMYVGLVADLVANADRRLGRGALDDALARLYRALEYVGQLRLHDEFGLSTAEFPVDRLHDEMGVQIADGADTCPLPLEKAWHFLVLEGDELGAMYSEFRETTELRTALWQRNHSLLAHGFQPVHEKYVQCLRDVVDQLAAAGWGKRRWGQLVESCRFASVEPFEAG